LQPLLPLVRRLKQAGYWVAAETNGTLWQELGLDWLTLSPKKEGLRLHQNGYDERFRKVASEFKYVITNAEDLKRVENNQGCPVILQPVDNNPEMVKAIIDFLKKEGRPQRFLRLQLQKVLNFR
ncbi:MAG TPA: hypothetical protein PKX93_08695, partial [bacterium]|nr:hypothetical protein [bacterium]